MDVKIYSVFHKPYWIPDDKVYVPIQVGFGSQIFNNNKPILRDDNGFNISNRNKNYCELTAIYWIWKNCHHDYIGVDHYRRHFAESRIGKKKTIILKSERLVRLLSFILIPSYFFLIDIFNTLFYIVIIQLHHHYILYLITRIKTSEHAKK